MFATMFKTADEFLTFMSTQKFLSGLKNTGKSMGFKIVNDEKMTDFDSQLCDVSIIAAKMILPERRDSASQIAEQKTMLIKRHLGYPRKLKGQSLIATVCNIISYADDSDKVFTRMLDTQFDSSLEIAKVKFDDSTAEIMRAVRDIAEQIKYIPATFADMKLKQEKDEFEMKASLRAAEKRIVDQFTSNVSIIQKFNTSIEDIKKSVDEVKSTVENITDVKKSVDEVKDTVQNMKNSIDKRLDKIDSRASKSKRANEEIKKSVIESKEEVLNTQKNLAHVVTKYHNAKSVRDDFVVDTTRDIIKIGFILNELRPIVGEVNMLKSKIIRNSIDISMLAPTIEMALDKHLLDVKGVLNAKQNTSHLIVNASKSVTFRNDYYTSALNDINVAMVARSFENKEKEAIYFLTKNSTNDQKAQSLSTYSGENIRERKKVRYDKRPFPTSLDHVHLTEEYWEWDDDEVVRGLSLDDRLIDEPPDFIEVKYER